MDHSYWLARENASKKLADLAPSIEARCVHLEMGRLYRDKCAELEHPQSRGTNMPEATEPSSEPPVAPDGLRADRPWSFQELAVLRSLNANGEAIAEIASRMRRTKQSVQNRLLDQMAKA